METWTFLRLLQAWLLAIVLGSFIGGILAVAGTLVFIPRTYEGTATLLVGAPLGSQPDYDRLLAYQLLARTYAEVATTRPILDQVIAEQGIGESPQDLARRVDARAPRDVNLILITARDGDATRSAAIANSVASRLVDLVTPAGSNGAPISLIEPAVPQDEPSSPRPLLALIVGLLAGAVVMVGIAVALDGDGLRRGGYRSGSRT